MPGIEPISLFKKLADNIDFLLDDFQGSFSTVFWETSWKCHFARNGISFKCPWLISLKQTKKQEKEQKTFFSGEKFEDGIFEIEFVFLLFWVDFIRVWFQLKSTWFTLNRFKGGSGGSAAAKHMSHNLEMLCSN